MYYPNSQMRKWAQRTERDCPRSSYIMQSGDPAISDLLCPKGLDRSFGPYGSPLGGTILVAESVEGLCPSGLSPKAGFPFLLASFHLYFPPSSRSLTHLPSLGTLPSLPPYLSCPLWKALLQKGTPCVQGRGFTCSPSCHRRSVRCSLRFLTRLWSCPWTTTATWT